MSRRSVVTSRVILAASVIAALAFGVSLLSTTPLPIPPVAGGSATPTASAPGAADGDTDGDTDGDPAGDTAGDTPGDTADLSAADALAALQGLPAAAWVDDGSYSGNRSELFGDAWGFDFDGNGCDARNDVLARDLTTIVFRPAECTVDTGILSDPYTGERIDFSRGADTSRDVQIDHLLPLKAVYATGGQAWSPEKREALANDPLNLLAVKGSENSSKSDSLPSDWLPGVYPDVSDRHDLGQRVAWDDLPSDTTLQCWYVETILPVFVAYELGVTPEDRAAMTAVLQTC